MNLKSSVFSGAAAIEGAIVSSMLSEVFNWEKESQIASLSAHGAAIAGQVFDHWQPVEHDQTLQSFETKVKSRMYALHILL